MVNLTSAFSLYTADSACGGYQRQREVHHHYDDYVI